jgi:hypothetical protein
MMENSTYSWMAGSTNQRGAYSEMGINVNETNRQQTSDFMYLPGAGAIEGTKKPMSYENIENQRFNTHRETLLDGYMVKGNMKMASNYVNAREVDKEHRNSRAHVPSVKGSIPSIETFGKVQHEQATYNTITNDRIDPTVLEMLKKNPYVHNVSDYFNGR